ncbi:hypothetical protein [Nocardioides zeae]
MPALEATAGDVLAADGIVLGTSANFGYMSGALKHFFDTTFLEIGGSLDDGGSAGGGSAGSGRRPGAASRSGSTSTDATTRRARCAPCSRSRAPCRGAGRPTCSASSATWGPVTRRRPTSWAVRSPR